MASKEVRVTDALTGGEKGSKPIRFDLLPSVGLQAIANVYGYGATKYADHNWRKGYKWSLSLAALHRHLEAWKRGERFDKESGQTHLAHVAWHCLTLMEWEELGLGTDDRVTATEGHLWYLAGLIDGEGCITIATNRRNGRKDGHVLNVSVKMTTPAALELLKARFGGSISKPSRRGNLTWKPIQCWNVGGQKALAVLELLEPLLVVKQEQARIGIAFQRQRAARKHLGRELTDAERQWDQEQQDRIKLLNKRGFDFSARGGEDGDRQSG